MKKKMLKFSILAFVFAVFECVVLGNFIVFAGENPSGELALTREQIVVSRLKSVFSNKSVTKGKEVIPYGAGQVQDITPLLKEAVQNYDSWSEESRAYVDIFLKRPDDTTNEWPWSSEEVYPPFYLSAPVRTFEPGSEYPDIEGRLKFWYVDNSESSHATTLDYVKSMASAFNTVYGTTIKQMGYPAPPDDSEVFDNGGDGKMDIYILNCGAYLVYGYTASELSDAVTPSFIVMDNDYKEFLVYGNTEEEAMKVTAAHEFHHAVQFGINSYSDTWIMEATSTWMEDQVFNTIDDNLQYLNSSQGFFLNPHESLNSEFQWYNSWIWLKYMETKFDKDSIKSLWLDYLASSSNSYLAVSNVLSDEDSTVRSAFSEFAKVNYTQSDFYPDYQSYIPVQISNEGSGIAYNLDYRFDLSDIFEAGPVSVNHLAAKYFKLTPGSFVNADDDDTLTIYINGEDNRQIDIFPVVSDTDLSFTEPLFSLDSANDGTLVIENFNASAITEVVLVLVNYSIGEENSSFKIRGGLGVDGKANREPGVTPEPTPITEKDSGGCFIGSI